MRLTTWKNMQDLVSALLAGDLKLPKEPEQRIELLKYGYESVMNKAVVLSLLVNRKATDLDDVFSQTSYGEFIRRPSLPTNDTDVLDIDKALVFAVARFMASFISKEKYLYHEQKAIELIKSYNNKVYAYDEEIVQNDI